MRRFCAAFAICMRYVAEVERVFVPQVLGLCENPSE